MLCFQARRSGVQGRASQLRQRLPPGQCTMWRVASFVLAPRRRGRPMGGRAVVARTCPPSPRRCTDPFLPFSSLAMAPHLSPADKDLLTQLRGQGLAPTAIHAKLTAKRARRGLAAPTIQNVRKALTGRTYKAALAETRGRKRKLTTVNARALNTARKALIKKAGGQEEVHWSDIMRKARVPKVDPTTAARAVRRVYPDVAWRPPRRKPVLTKKHREERVAVCKVWMKKPASFFTRRVHIMIDNKRFAIPTNATGKARLKMTKVRGHIRRRQEGSPDRALGGVAMAMLSPLAWAATSPAIALTACLRAGRSRPMSPVSAARG